MTPPTKDHTAPEQQALRWAEYLKHGETATKEQLQEIDDWVRRSEDNLLCLYEEMAVAEALDLVRRSREASATPQPDLDHWVAIARRELAILDGDRSESEVPPPPRRSSLWPRVAAMFALCTVAFFAVWTWGSNAPYSPHVGTDEPHTVMFRDGSEMTLWPHSVARARYSWSSREVQLLKGEAEFKVRHDDKWPFEVDSGAAKARALGTQFHVRLSEPGATFVTAVSVSEGLVRVTPSAAGRVPTDISAGREALVSADGAVAVLPLSDHVDSAAEPSSTRTPFEIRTLAQIAALFNRGNRLPRLIIEGAACALPLRVTGDPNDLEDFIDLLKSTFAALEVDRTSPGEVRVRDRNDRSRPGSESDARCVVTAPVP
jgi:ferric-dicitrate binding protein FerR (iron transport regulator)